MPEIPIRIYKAIPLPARLHLLLFKHLQPLLGRSFLESFAGVEAVDEETRFAVRAVVRTVSHLLAMNHLAFFNNIMASTTPAGINNSRYQ